jgi:hypothetical protein
MSAEQIKQSDYLIAHPPAYMVAYYEGRLNTIPVELRTVSMKHRAARFARLARAVRGPYYSGTKESDFITTFIKNVAIFDEFLNIEAFPASNVSRAKLELKQMISSHLSLIRLLRKIESPSAREAAYGVVRQVAITGGLMDTLRYVSTRYPSHFKRELAKKARASTTSPARRKRLEATIVALGLNRMPHSIAFAESLRDRIRQLLPEDDKRDGYPSADAIKRAVISISRNN